LEVAEGVRLTGVASTGQLAFSVRSGGRVPLSQLGFVERNAFVLAAAPVVMGLQRSVVLLDLPELGLAPGAAVRWLEVLRGYAQHAQWIVASRDPALVSAAAKDRIDLPGGAP
jgi:hypothetical protein